MGTRISFYFIILSIIFLSCQKEIEVKLPAMSQKLVVEGYIEIGEYPIVMLTRTLPNFNNFNIDTFLYRVLVRDATVHVYSSKGESEKLTFQQESRSPIMFAYVGKNIKGEIGTNYRLKIEWNNNTYEANTSILAPFSLDSVIFVPSTFNVDSSAILRVFFKDNGHYRDYYQFFTKIRAKNLYDPYWVTTIPVVFDDLPFNGQPFNMDIYRANPSNLMLPTMLPEEEAEYYRMTFKRGDTVLLKYTTIDYYSYQYWLTASSEISFGQNPFMNPIPIQSNIKGKDVLGIWCGYASKVDTLYY